MVASWGYVVAAPRACVDGVCPEDDYPRQQTNVIDWAKEQADDEIFQGVDFSGGVGIFGHSMGGRAALQNAAEPRAAEACSRFAQSDSCGLTSLLTR